MNVFNWFKERRERKERRTKKAIRLEKLRMRGFKQIDNNRMVKSRDILGFWCHTCDKDLKSKEDVKNHLRKEHKVFLAKFGEEKSFVNFSDADKETSINIKQVAIEKRKEKAIRKEKVRPIKYIQELKNTRK